jgi:hypothetical protein
MNVTRRSFLALVGGGSAALALAQEVDGSKILRSWNPEGAIRSLMAYVQKVTREGSPDFIPVPERIAVFDNDGTLWPENPIPFQAAFVLDTLKTLVQQKPELRDNPDVKAALTGDLRTLVADHYRGLFTLIALTHDGVTVEEYERRVSDWMSTARHPRYGRPYDECIYQPMLEVLQYLRENRFKTWIVSGGGADFMRVWSERVYGIPPEQVIGSHGGARYEMRDGNPVMVKSTNTLFIDDREGKPVGIHQLIGRRPVVCVGNSDGDKAMLEYTTINNRRLSFGMLVHHTDAEREYAYDAQPRSTGKLVEALADAGKRGWVVADMKRDFRRMFPFDQ